MKSFYILALFVGMQFISCSKDEHALRGDFEFISDYSATITVGGIIGVTERRFKAGEVYEGLDEGGDSIRIRIAAHTERNDECPNPWCYQEYLDVPREYLKYLK